MLVEWIVQWDDSAVERHGTRTHFLYAVIDVDSRTYIERVLLTSPCSSLAVELTTKSSLLQAIESSTSNLKGNVRGTLLGPRVCANHARQ